MDTTSTTLEDLGKAVARIQDSGVYITGWGLVLVISFLVAIAGIIAVFTASND